MKVSKLSLYFGASNCVRYCVLTILAIRIAARGLSHVADNKDVNGDTYYPQKEPQTEKKKIGQLLSLGDLHIGTSTWYSARTTS